MSQVFQNRPVMDFSQGFASPFMASIQNADFVMPVPTFDQGHKLDSFESEETCVSISAFLANRAGTLLTLSEDPSNHRFVRPDDTIHLLLQPSRDITIMLSETFEDSQQTHSRWMGQFNGREEFKVTHLRNYKQTEFYRLAFTANTSWLDYRVAMGASLVSINGHLAIRLEEDKAVQFSLGLSPQVKLGPGFTIAVSLQPVSSEIWQEAPTYLSFGDFFEPTRFTTQHARRQALKRNSSSRNSLFS